MMNDDGYATADAARDDAFEGRALVAAFADRESAHDAAGRLKDEGFHRIWIGVTHAADDSSEGGRYAPPSENAGQMTVSSDEGGSVFAKIGRFFSGESGERTLYDELVRHGVAESEARRIDGSLEPNSAILTLDGANHPELAAQIVEACGGHVLAGESFGSYAGSGAAAYDDTTLANDTASRDTLRGSQVLGYGDAAQYARGEQIDDERRIQLREERLNIDKRRESAGEATIGKEVVENRQDVDVPVVREELFVERRPVAQRDVTATDTTPIREGETIRVPLMREEVSVTKRPVVTEEAVIGKRTVTDTQHVSETTRSERLKVDDGALDTDDLRTR